MSQPILRKTIYQLAQQLGANVSGGRTLPSKIKNCPPFIHEFYTNIIFPKKKEYDALALGNGPTTVNFGGNLERHSDIDIEIVGAERMDLYFIGCLDDGNYLLAMDGNEKNKANPMIYEIDHETPEVREFCRLIQLLQALIQKKMSCNQLQRP